MGVAACDQLEASAGHVACIEADGRRIGDGGGVVLNFHFFKALFR